MTSDVLNKVPKKIKIKIQKISLFNYGYFICLPLNYCNLALMLHICYLDGLFDTVDNGWRYDFALGGVPSLCLFVGFIFCPESPRYWLGLPSKFCSEEIPRNRLATVNVILRKKGSFRGIPFVSEKPIPRFGTKRNVTERYRIPRKSFVLKSSV